MNKVEPRESEIQAAVMDYLALKKHFFFRNNNTPIYDSARQTFRRMPSHALRGVSDVILVRSGGIACFLEIKRPGAVLSVWQAEFRDACTKAGAEYHVIYSVDDLKKIGL